MVFWCGGGELVDLVLYCTFVIPIWQMMDTVMHSVLTDIKGQKILTQQRCAQAAAAAVYHDSLSFFSPLYSRWDFNPVIW